MLSKLGFMRGRITREDEHRPPLGREKRPGVEQAQQVLVWTFRGGAQHDGPVGEAETVSKLGLGRRFGGWAHPLRDDVELARRYLEQTDEVVACARRRSDDPVRAPRCKRDQDAHPGGSQTGMRLGIDAVDEVVDRDHAAEMAPDGSGTPETVEDVDPGPGAEARQELLFTANPLRTPAGADRHEHLLRELPGRRLPPPRPRG